MIHPIMVDELWDADPNCKHNIICNPGGGIKCTKCKGWVVFDMHPKCPSCKIELQIIPANEPWTEEYYQCSKCDGTYNISEFCVFCELNVYTRQHHIIPKSKGGMDTVNACETCENWVHNKWSHNQLRDTYNNVETILNDEDFQKFLKWRKKQSTTTLFKSEPGKFRDKRKYS